MQLPKSWADVTISQYYQMVSIYNVCKNDVVLQEMKILALLSGKPFKDVEDMTMSQITASISNMAFLSELPSEKITPQFKLKGNYYKAILLTKQMQAGQFIDFSSVGKDCQADELVYHMHELLACMCLKRGEFNWGKFSFEYVYEGYDSISDDFLELPMSIAYPFYVFFCNVLINSQKPIQDYFLNKAKKEIKKVEKMLAST